MMFSKKYTYILTPISSGRSDPSSSIILQGRAFLLNFPEFFLPLIFWSARPLTLRRLKNRNILPLLRFQVTSDPTFNLKILLLFESWFLLKYQPTFLFIHFEHFTFYYVDQATSLSSFTVKISSHF